MPHPLVDKIVTQLEASPSACTAVAADQPQRQRVEADVVRFMMLAPVPQHVRFQVMDCADDGFVYQGTTIVLSSRLSRLSGGQRFFIIAHELGHVALQHHAATSKFVAKVVRNARDERAARARVASGLPAMSQQNELDADAYAIRLMREAGEDRTRRRACSRASAKAGTTRRIRRRDAARGPSARCCSRPAGRGSRPDGGIAAWQWTASPCRPRSPPMASAGPSRVLKSNSLTTEHSKAVTRPGVHEARGSLSRSRERVGVRVCAPALTPTPLPLAGEGSTSTRRTLS
jgi:hypothetical protein